MTSNDIIQGFIDFVFRDRRQNKVFPNIFIDRFECDILELTKSGYLYEYEVKVSRSDFKADAKKATFKESKYQSIQSGLRVNYFYYVVPENLISVDDVPEFAGLIYAKNREVTFYSDELGYYSKDRMFFNIQKQAKKLSGNKISEKKMFKLLESIYYRFHSYKRKISDLKIHNHEQS